MTVEDMHDFYFIYFFFSGAQENHRLGTEPANRKKIQRLEIGRWRPTQKASKLFFFFFLGRQNYMLLGPRLALLLAGGGRSPFTGL